MDFYLGGDTQALGWGVPVMVSHGRLRRLRRLPRASAPWVCDSRGFTELFQHGRWTIGANEYVDAMRRYHEQIGMLRWASPQDWMCEPFITAKTGLTVADHQHRTVDNLLTLRDLAPDLRWIPVLQGWQLGDYLRCVDMYTQAGVDLLGEPIVGLGSVCRRQATSEIHTIVSILSATGLRMHGFGVKTAAIEAVGGLLASADSEAWSYAMRRRVRHCTHGLARWAANCRVCAMGWRTDVLSRLGSVQLAMDLAPREAAVPP